MTSAIEIRQAPPQRLLAKKATCTHNDIAAAFGAAIKAVGDCYKASGAKMTSAPVAVYLAWRESDCDMAVGCKVEGNVTLTGGCEWLDVPGGPHAFATHLGPYDTLHETHTAIRKWCTTNGHKMVGPCWETYPIDPALESDSSKWQTDVYYPVDKKQ
jgi:effector-binding domain-containing protein